MRRNSVTQFITRKRVVLYILTFLLIVGSFWFVHNNHALYERSIAEIVEVETVQSEEVTDPHGNEDKLVTQELEGVIQNGDAKGSVIQLDNEYAESQAYNDEYTVGNDLFVSIDSTNEAEHLTGSILDVKRDQYTLVMAWAFIIILLLVGQRQGFYSVISLAINALIIALALNFYIQTTNISLLIISGVSIVLFTVISLLLVNGNNEKTYAAIAATLLGTLFLFAVTSFVMWGTAGEGLRYEEMQFVTRAPEMVFMAGVLIGALGAIMDVAITMSSSLFNLYEKNNNITSKALRKSGMDIGKDIMGTMTNILFFVYISGSMPMIILYLKNSAALGFTLNMNLSLELARALAGGIGIVVTIPIGVYLTIFFINRKRARV
ncbi:YibE/F family protein [Alkalibacillus haloalkaliphilus]|uniref:YibE/F family protein n=1 Tax=Alkalibacillus haloalkaliphilus TaxID=94136 RepID=UPI002936A6D8|nr:YibE/F family protein [Alkalibacillus haloalkaliphilus]MDV2581906.1 YibE/F family protein [Alkalibacillus haloalkaliphilus]